MRAILLGRDRAVNFLEVFLAMAWALEVCRRSIITDWPTLRLLSTSLSSEAGLRPTACGGVKGTSSSMTYLAAEGSVLFSFMVVYRVLLFGLRLLTKFSKGRILSALGLFLREIQW